jgi:hypothetical protein
MKRALPNITHQAATGHIQVGNDLSHAVHAVVPGRARPLAAPRPPEPRVVVVNFFPLQQGTRS